MRIVSLAHVVLSIVLAVVSCSEDKESDNVETTQWTTQKVAVVLPMRNGQDTHWKRTLNQCAEDLEKAFSGLKTGIRLEYEWYDELTENIDELSENLAQRKDIVAVIGGAYSDNAKIMASKFCRSVVKKPFFTLATTEELVRGYSSAGCLWALMETDISQCETLLSLAYSYRGKSVALIADGNSMYGKTFVDWFAFQAQELGLKTEGIYDTGEIAIEEAAANAAKSGVDFLICAPSSVEDVRVIEEAMYKQACVGNPLPPQCLYSDVAFGAEVIEMLGTLAEGLEGVAVGADPSSGFDVRYEATYNETPLGGESQLYDAATMIGYASFIQHDRNILSLNDAIKTLVDGRDDFIYSPTPDGMRDFISALSVGKAPNLRGVSGQLDFDTDVYTNVLSSTYYAYKVYGGKYIILDYISNNGSSHTSSSLANWQWKSSKMQEFEDVDSSGLTYPDLDEKWALLVAGSSGWTNYRHQADILYIYQLLRQNGYDDDHIVLIAEDDIANNTQNPTPGYMSVRVGGENVYRDVQIDYHTSDITPADIKSILCGERDSRLSQVIDADEDDNVFIFWSGHGSKGQLQWLDERKGFTRELAEGTFKAMYEKRCYRKVLCMVEACYSGSVFTAIEGLPGMLAFTAANAYESSKADVYNCDLDVWMSNRFTMTFRDCITNNPQMSLRDLYYKLFVNTVGSHVLLFNANNYGNIFKNNIGEFL